MRVWVAWWSDGHDGEYEVLGVYATEELAKAAVEHDIATRYEGNPRAKAEWGSFGGVNVYFGCGHSDRYSWYDYEVQES